MLSVIQITFQVFFKAFIVHGILFSFFIYFALIFLKRERTESNRLLSAFYISVMVGLFFNFLFVLIQVELWVHLLYYLTLYFLILGTVFLALFLFLLYRADIVSTKFKRLYILLFSVSYFFTLLIPGGLTLNASTQWSPIYSLTYFIVLLLILTVFAFAPVAYLNLKLYSIFENNILKKRWILFMIGTILLFVFAYGTLISHVMASAEFKLYWTYIALVVIISSSVLLYLGVIRVS